MAIYEYQCKTCGNVQERTQSITVDKPKIIECERCGKDSGPILSGNFGTLFPQGRCKGGYDRPSF